MNREEIIKESYNKDCFALVFRHSIREVITDARQSIYQLLTPEGKDLARDFGSKLCTQKPIRLFHSSIERCRETAICIQEGFKGETVSLVPHDVLIGFFVYNIDVILGDVNKIGSYEYIKKWYSQGYNETDIMNFFSARKKMMDTFIQNQDDKYLDIYVSHDWNVVVLLSLYYDIINSKYPWPNFMHGISLRKTNDTVYFFSVPDEKVKIEDVMM